MLPLLEHLTCFLGKNRVHRWVFLRRKDAGALAVLADRSGNDRRSQDDAVLKTNTRAIEAADIFLDLFSVAARACGVHLEVLLVDHDAAGSLAVPAWNFLEEFLSGAGLAGFPDDANLGNQVSFTGGTALGAWILEQTFRRGNVEATGFVELMVHDGLLQTQLVSGQQRDLVLLVVVEGAVEQDRVARVQLLDG